MFSCTTLQDSLSIQKWRKCLQWCHLLTHVSTPFNLQYYNACSKYPPSAHRHALSCARVLSMDVSTTRCSMLCQAISRRCGLDIQLFERIKNPLINLPLNFQFLHFNCSVSLLTTEVGVRFQLNVTVNHVIVTQTIRNPQPFLLCHHYIQRDSIKNVVPSTWVKYLCGSIVEQFQSAHWPTLDQFHCHQCTHSPSAAGRLLASNNKHPWHTCLKYLCPEAHPETSGGRNKPETMLPDRIHHRMGISGVSPGEILELL